jgi:hypothetical protein
MSMSLFDARVLRCLLSDQFVTAAELAAVSNDWRPLAERLAATPLEGRQSHWVRFLDDQSDRNDITKALADVDPLGPAPPIGNALESDLDEPTIPTPAWPAPMPSSGAKDPRDPNLPSLRKVGGDVTPKSRVAESPRPTRPPAPRVNEIPSELRERPQWVVWKYQSRNGKWAKVPYQPEAPACGAKADDPSTWATFDKAWDRYQRGGFDGVGYEFSKDDPYFGIDLDNCRHDGEVLEWAQPHVGKLKATYGEVSPSGSGIKFIAKGKLPGATGGNRKGFGPDRAGGIEVYDHGRFFTVTGDRVSECQIVDLQEVAADLYRLVKEKPASRPAADNSQPRGSGVRSAPTSGANPEARARAYVFAPSFPNSIAGQNGHDRLFHVACVLWDGFGLSRDQAMPIFREWNAQKAEPPEDEYQLNHKLDDAIKANPVPSCKLESRRGGGRQRRKRRAAEDSEDAPALAGVPGGALAATPPAANQEVRETHSEILLRLASTATLFHDDSGTAFASIVIKGHHETYRIRGSGFRRWLTHRFYREQNRPPSAQSLQDSLGIIEANAQFDGRAERVYVRVAERDGRIYLDLGDDDWRAAEIDATGWRIVEDPPVLFRRPAGLLHLPEPVRGGAVAKLKDFVNIDGDDFLLLVAFLAAALRVTGPYPILILNGEQGSSKSTLARIVRKLIDPHVVLLRCEPREPRDLVIGAVNGWVLALDNISVLPGWLSDALCRLSTGGGHATRTLYTNDEETFLDAQRPVILTGITDFVNRGDLIDRCVFLHLPAIPDDKRQTEAKFHAAFDAEYPQLLGALLDVVAAGLRELPSVQITSIPRMADFALFGEAVSRGMGHDADKFLEVYRDNRKFANESALEDNPVAGAIRELMARQDPWSGTASELLAALREIVSEKVGARDQWPKTARALSGVLRRLAPSLRMVGICVTFPQRKNKARTITVEKGGNQPSLPSPPSPKDTSGDPPTGCEGDGRVTVGVTVETNRHLTVTPPSPLQSLTSHEVIADSDGGDGGDGQIPTFSTEETEI